MITHRFRWAVAATATAAASALFLLPVSNPVPEAFGLVDTDKLAHLGLIGTLAALAFWSLSRTKVRFAEAILLASAYAGAVEVVQALLPYRTGDVWDFVYGVIGAVIAVAATRVFRQYWYRNHEERKL